jgi:N4-gp56 family major capsid protein
MATGNMTITTHAEFIPEIWSNEVLFQANNASVFANLVRRDFDGEINTSGDTVHIPLFSQVTTATKQANTAVTYTNYTESVTSITIDAHTYFAFRIEDIARVQSKPDLISGYSRQGAAGISTDMDVALATLITDATITQNVGAHTSSDAAYTDITDAVIRDAIQALDEANAPEEGRYLVISPAQKNALLGIAKFVEVDKRGDDTIISKGRFGEIYGVQVFISNNLIATASVASVASSGGASEVNLEPAHHSCMMFHREAFALATQIAPRVQAAYDLDHLATSVVGDVLYGADVLVPTFAVLVRTTSE